jgi:Holliday junction resolvase
VGRSNYYKGRDREYYAVRRLREAGALEVTRSYGSHGLFDVRGVFRNRVVLVQVKKDRVPRDELERLKEFASKVTSPDIRVQVWIYHGRGRRVEVLELPNDQVRPIPQ